MLSTTFQFQNMTHGRSEDPDDVGSMQPVRPSCSVGDMTWERNEAKPFSVPGSGKEGKGSTRLDKEKIPDDSVKEAQKGKELQNKYQGQQQQKLCVASQERNNRGGNRAISHRARIHDDSSSSNSSASSDSTVPGAHPVAGPRASDQNNIGALDNIGSSGDDEEQQNQVQHPARDRHSNIDLAVTAVAVDDPAEASIIDVGKILKDQRRRIIVGSVILLIVIVASVVPLSIFLPPEEGNSAAQVPTPPPASPTDVPTQNPTAKPTQVNSICQGAIVISENDKVVGSTLDGGIVGESFPKLCPDIDINTTVVWFKMVGSGALFEGNLCASGTGVNGTNTSAVSQELVEEGFNLHVFSGSCDNFTCVSPFDEASSVHFCGGMNWVSELGTSYYLLISGEETASNFSLQVDSRNDICEGSLGPLDLGGEYPGTTVAAPIVSLPECGGSIEHRGVWYSVMGTGSVLEATTCTSSSDSTFDTQLALFIGGCENLSCVVQNDDSSYHGDEFMCDYLSWVTWDSLPGELYHILVYGFDGDETGDFVLKVREYNDDCEHAVSLEIGFVDTGNTEFATPDGIEECGGSPESSRPGVWWKTFGTGRWMVATMCTSMSLNGDFDSSITILTGRCDGNLSCVAGNQNGTVDCGTEAEVHWSSREGQIYYILVHKGPVNPSVDTFGIELRDALNDRCELTFEPMQRNTTLRDTTENARPHDVEQIPACGGLGRSTQGLWYVFYGTGEHHRTTADPDDAYSFQVWIFRGNCDALECVATSQASGFATAVWDSELGEVYHIFINGARTPQVGYFELEHVSEPLP